MSNYQQQREHGAFSRFEVPIEIDGLLCGGVFRFEPAPQNPVNRNSKPKVVSGVIDRIDSLGNNKYRIVCKRGVQYSDTLIVRAPGDSYQFVWGYASGGNICAADESMRGISNFNSQMSYGGNMSSVRAVPSDGFRLKKGSKTYPVNKIVEAKPYSVPGSQVNWNPENNLPENVYIDAELYDIQFDGSVGTITVDEQGVISQNETIGNVFFDPDTTGLFAGSFLRISDGVTLQDINRKVFNGDEGLYPDNAQFSNSIPEYWFDPLTLDFRISSKTADFGTDGSIFYWVENIINPLQVEANQLINFTGGGLPHDEEEGDRIALSVHNETGNFEEEFEVLQGDGWIEWRRNGDLSSDFFAVYWDENLDITAAKKREDGIFEDVAFTPGTIAQNIKLKKLGSQFTFYVGGVSKATTAIANVDDDTDGMVGIGTVTGVQFFRSVESNRFILDLTGDGIARHHVFRFNTFTLQGSRDFSLFDPSRSYTVFNETTNKAMVNSSEKRRDTYQLVEGNKIRFGAETNGDLIRISYAADSTPKAAPGRPPRTFNQKNFGTLNNGVGTSWLDYISTTSQNENVGNWRDSLVIQWEGPGSFPAAVGDSFDVVRWLVFDPEDTPVIYYDIKNSVTDWAELLSSNFRAMWAEGLVFVSKAFLDLMNQDDLLCLMAEGKVYRNSGTLQSHYYNEAKNAINELEHLYSVGELIGPSPSIGGTAYIGTGITGWVCSGTSAVPTSAAWGLLPDTPGDTVRPYWDIDYFNDITLFTSSVNAVFNPPLLTCEGVPIPNIQITPNRILITAKPYGDSQASGGFHFGSLPDGEGGFFGASLAQFSFSAIPFSPAGKLARLPSGTTIEHAYLEVKLRNFGSQDWSFQTIRNYESYPTITTTYAEHYKNGQLVYNNEESNIAPPDYVNKAKIAFVLVGKRLNSENITMRDGQVVQHPNTDFVSLATTSTANVVDGEAWDIINVKDAVQAIVNAKNTDYTSFELWATTGVGLANAGGNGLASYAQSLIGNYSSSFTTDPVTGYLKEATWNCSGSYVYGESISIGRLLYRYRLPSGMVEDRTIPIRFPQLYK